MSELIVWREKIQNIYANYSLYIDKAIQFVLGIVTFFLINQNIGFMKSLATPVVSLALAVICTFLPAVFTVFAAAALVLLHFFKVSLGVMGVSALIFMMMFIFYCRFTPKRALVLLITPLAFMLHIPYAVPIVCGLVLSPVAAIPIVFGTIVFYMISCVKNSAAAISGTNGMTAQISLFVKTVFQNKVMWITAIAFIICILTVYAVRRLAVDHAWTIAIAAGAVVNILVIVIGDIAFDVHTSYGMLVFGNMLSIVIGLVMEFFLFAVDYSRAEQLQYEDDEYYYYVKAVPKISIAVPEKTVKKINERRDTEDKETEEIKQKNQIRSGARRLVKKQESNSVARKVPQQKKTRVPASTEELLLAKSLQEELDIQNIVKKELEDK